MAFMWAAAICTALPAPPTPSNLRGLNSCIQCEGGTGHNNPMNTTLSCCGATGNFNSVGVKIYPNPAAGVLATVKTLRNGRYPAIVSALRSGTFGQAILSDPAVRAQLAVWGTGADCPSRVLGGKVTAQTGGGTSYYSGSSLPQRATASVLGAGAVGVGGLLLVALLLGVAAWWFLFRGKR